MKYASKLVLLVLAVALISTLLLTIMSRGENWSHEAVRHRYHDDVVDLSLLYIDAGTLFPCRLDLETGETTTLLQKAFSNRAARVFAVPSGTVFDNYLVPRWKRSDIGRAWDVYVNDGTDTIAGCILLRNSGATTASVIDRSPNNMDWIDSDLAGTPRTTGAVLCLYGDLPWSWQGGSNRLAVGIADVDKSGDKMKYAEIRRSNTWEGHALPIRLSKRLVVMQCSDGVVRIIDVMNDQYFDIVKGYGIAVVRGWKREVP